ncbi:MAG TPA: glycosyltransferase family 4 protein [Anaerolineaceae bacterium]|nr:glycosyltransferase family 4 protein [Anaerolineaceae bacterium]
MRILIALTYYRPHYSGLTIYTERLARALVQRGHQVTVITSRFDRSLKAREVRDGVEIVRPWVLGRVSKGVLMPTMGIQALELTRKADVVNLHVPQLDAAPISIQARLLGKPVVLTYHCDLQLPAGLIHRVANQVSHVANHISARNANRIVTNTRDYAEHSPFLKNYLDKVEVIAPPVVLPESGDQDAAAFRQKFQIQKDQKIVGMAARLATEKGVEYLIEAMPEVLKHHPDARVLFVGQHQNVLGEEQYAARLAPMLDQLNGHWSFLGILAPSELAAFFKECRATVLPSINGTESFGMVQIESMSCGTPVIATDIPGVRQPVTCTGMGEIVPPRNSLALAKALIRLLDRPENYCGDPEAIKRQYAPDSVAAHYEALFRETIEKR